MICAVVLAAGRSERMGTQKLLLPLGGKAVIARVVDELSASQVEKTFVVVGCDGERIRQTLTGKTVQFVENPDVASDMLGSVRCGLRVLPAGCQATLVALGDQPGITGGLINNLIHYFHHRDSRIVVPACNGHRGHPVLIGTEYFEEVLTSHTNAGLRGFLDAHPREVINVPLSDATATEDMDTPADYHRQKQLFENGYTDTVSPA